MRTKKLFVLALVAVTVAAQQPPPPFGPSIPLEPPRPTQATIDEFSWQTFVALNWPALLDDKGRPVRDDNFPNGKPDTAKAFGDRGPRVWEGLKADHELFREGGKEPIAWNQYDNTLPCTAGAVEDGSGEKILTLLSEGTSMQSGVNQAMAGPLIDRFGSYVHYEVRHNRPYYDYVRDNKFYLRKELDAKTRWPKPKADFPISDGAGKYGALEIKAAWRVLDPSESEEVANRYYWTWARIPDPKTEKCGPPQRVALVGLHILQKVKGFNAWLWATFEHEDNVPCNYPATDDCPAAPDHYSFNANDQQLDDAARENRGYVPKRWSTGGLSAAKWKPIDPVKLPAEPIANADRINAVRMRQVRQSAGEENYRFHHAPGIAGTFWEHYILIDTQWPFEGNGKVVPADPTKPYKLSDYVTGALDPVPGPNRDADHPVANVTMETFYQEVNPDLPQFGASCMQCHFAAAQRDFSWTLANRAWPPTLATKPKTDH
jgi:hypothetical protein